MRVLLALALLSACSEREVTAPRPPPTREATVDTSALKEQLEASTPAPSRPELVEPRCAALPVEQLHLELATDWEDLNAVVDRKLARSARATVPAHIELDGLRVTVVAAGPKMSFRRCLDADATLAQRVRAGLSARTPLQWREDARGTPVETGGILVISTRHAAQWLLASDLLEVVAARRVVAFARSEDEVILVDADQPGLLRAAARLSAKRHDWMGGRGCLSEEPLTLSTGGWSRWKAPSEPEFALHRAAARSCFGAMLSDQIDALRRVLGEEPGVGPAPRRAARRDLVKDRSTVDVQLEGVQLLVEADGVRLALPETVRVLPWSRFVKVAEKALEPYSVDGVRLEHARVFYPHLVSASALGSK